VTASFPNDDQDRGDAGDHLKSNRGTPHPHQDRVRPSHDPFHIAHRTRSSTCVSGAGS
jgi:hypothetical protein